MKADPLAYKRATGVSLFGLGVQAALAVVILLYAVFARDAAALTGAFYILLGLPIWLALALVHHQHRLERIEAAEAEVYAAGGDGPASAFSERPEDLQVAARRLEWMHRILLPVLSLLIGSALIGVGLWQLSLGREALESDAVLPLSLTGWAVAVGLTLAVVGFIFARFVAGMAKQEVWTNLRAGAAAAVGSSVVGVAMAAAHALAFTGVYWPLKWLFVALPALMVALGVEIFLNFVLNVYRPRRVGEVPRPAFDSRILGFFAAPDRIAESVSDAINYQFGFNVSSTWFYQLLSRSLVSLAVLGGLVIWGLTTLAVVEPNERGLLLQFGRLVDDLDSGLHAKWPWPFQTVETYPALRVNRLEVGTHQAHGDGPILWTNEHGDEGYLLVQASAQSGGGRDLALVAVEFVIHYEVTDLEVYTLLAADGADSAERDSMRRALLESVASRVLISYLGSRTIDDVLGREREQMNADLRRLIEAAFAALGPVAPDTGRPLGAGVRTLFMGMTGAHPPQSEEVALSFERMVSSEQRSEGYIEQARAAAIRSLAGVTGDVELARRIIAELDRLEAMTERGGASPEEVALQEGRIEELLGRAGGAAAEMIAAAKADRWQRHMEIRARAERQAGRIALYRAAPEVYRAGRYFNALLDAVSGSRLYITAFDNPSMDFDFQQIQSNITGFDIETAQE